MSTRKIHNVRFYDLVPKAVTCLAYEPNTRKLALSRNDNSLEIWNIENVPFIESTIADPPHNSCEAILWVDSRLFSCGISGSIVEYNLSSLTVKLEALATGGAAWCIDVNQSKTHLAVGTEDGYVNIFSITLDGLVYEKIFDKQNGRILCIKWDKTGEMLYTGSMNAIRIWNVPSGHAIRKMSTGKNEIRKATIVWCLAVTSDNMLVSGDSRGTLSIWDPSNGILVESHQCQSADILAVTLSSDMNTIYCAGVDPTIRTFSSVIVKSCNRSQWVRGIERKLHDHDVRALVEVDGKLYSAGVDGYLAQSSFPPRILVKYPPLLQPPCISVCPKSRCIMLKYSNYLELWQLGSISDNCLKEPVKILHLKAKNEKNIVSYAISHDSKLIVYSTSSHVRAFSFDIYNGHPQLCKVSSDIQTKNVHKMSFTPNDIFLVVISNMGSGNSINLYKISSKHIQFYRTLPTSQQFTANIGLISFSPDSKYLVCSDLHSHITIYNIKDNQSESCEHWPLPKYRYPPTAMAVQGETSNLVIVYTDHKIFEYNILKKQTTEFSKTLQKYLPSNWLMRPFPILNIMFDSKNKNVIIMHDDTTMFIIDKKIDFENPKIKVPKFSMENGEGNNSSGTESNSQQIIRVVKRYKHLVYLDWIDGTDMVAVQVDPESLLEKLPPRLKEKKFGT